MDENYDFLHKYSFSANQNMDKLDTPCIHCLESESYTFSNENSSVFVNSKMYNNEHENKTTFLNNPLSINDLECNETKKLSNLECPKLLPITTDYLMVHVG